MAVTGITKTGIKKESLFMRILKNKEVYLVLLPGIAWYVIFAYLPLYGLTLAFKTFKANMGIFRSPWVGLLNYVYVLRDQAFVESILRTLQINLGRLLFTFPIPIILALAINELRVGRYKKILQTIYTFPNFLSWVIVASILNNTLNQNGMVNAIIKMAGGDPVNFLGSVQVFLPLVYITEIWKSSGWSAIIYLAALAGIDVEQYEAAEIDGASRFQRILHISFPGIKATIIVMLVLAIGYVMSAGFDQLFNISNSATFRAAESLDMYIYRVTFRSASDFSFSTAVALVRSVINCILLITADRVTRMVSGSGLFG
ncbi:MAG: ABC transporter permease subunit [Treponema sp.]|jgi:putative aldouronate transport system permease protein|nr:ABC transporter permease subunit [Treponema sp.]